MYLVRYKESKRVVQGLVFRKRSEALKCVQRLSTKGQFAVTYKRLPAGVRRG
jgi:hypothetical protein